jgi:hypothetical protein
MRCGSTFLTRQLLIERAGLRREILKVANEYRKQLLLCLEPLGEQVILEPHSVHEIVTSGGEEGPVEIILEDDKLTVYGWNGSNSAVFRAGKFVAGIDPPR